MCTTGYKTESGSPFCTRQSSFIPLFPNLKQRAIGFQFNTHAKLSQCQQLQFSNPTSCSSPLSLTPLGKLQVATKGKDQDSLPPRSGANPEFLFAGLRIRPLKIIQPEPRHFLADFFFRNWISRNSSVISAWRPRTQCAREAQMNDDSWTQTQNPVHIQNNGLSLVCLTCWFIHLRSITFSLEIQLTVAFLTKAINLCAHENKVIILHLNQDYNHARRKCRLAWRWSLCFSIAARVKPIHQAIMKRSRGASIV